MATRTRTRTRTRASPLGKPHPAAPPPADGRGGAGRVAGRGVPGGAVATRRCRGNQDRSRAVALQAAQPPAPPAAPTPRTLLATPYNPLCTLACSLSRPLVPHSSLRSPFAPLALPPKHQNTQIDIESSTRPGVPARVPARILASLPSPVPSARRISVHVLVHLQPCLLFLQRAHRFGPKASFQPLALQWRCNTLPLQIRERFELKEGAARNSAGATALQPIAISCCPSQHQEQRCGA